MEKKYKIIENADLQYIRDNGIIPGVTEVEYDEGQLIRFLNENQGQEIIIKDIEGENVKICRYEGKKTFMVSLHLLEEITSEIEEKAPKNYEFAKKIYEKIKNINPWIIVFILLGFIFIFQDPFNTRKESKADNEPIKVEIQKSEIQLISEKIQELEKEKIKKLEFQKNQRDKKQESIKLYDGLISQSIEEVKKIDEQINENRIKQIQKAQ